MPPEQVPEAFRELLRSLVRKHGTRDAVGKKIGMSGSRVGRAIEGQYSFNLKNCLKLAEAFGESPSMVLRAAGKGDVAELIERLYGASRPTLGAGDRELVDRWSKLDVDERDWFKGLIWKLTEGRVPKKAKRTA